MARQRSWSTHLDDKMLMNEIDKMLAQGMIWNGEEGIGVALGTSGPNANQYYNRRLEKFNVQQSIRDLFTRIQFMEERIARGNIIPDNGRNASPPSPPRNMISAPPPPPSDQMLLQAELKKAVKDLTKIIERVDVEKKGVDYLAPVERLDGGEINYALRETESS